MPENALIHLGMFKMRVTGSGNMALQLRTFDQLNQVSLIPFALNPTEQYLLQRLTNYIGQGIILRGSAREIDDTCRVQTVTKEQNEHYYNLISAFRDITDVPVLFNTSFNLAGDPLVETIDNALDTLYRSKLKYLYLPELNLLVTKTEES